jgi:hypothetical protein
VRNFFLAPTNPPRARWRQFWISPDATADDDVAVASPDTGNGPWR